MSDRSVHRPRFRPGLGRGLRPGLLRPGLRPGTLSRLGCIAAAAITLAAAGCESKSFIDPSELVEANKNNTVARPLVVPILEDLDFGLIDNNAYFTQARPVQPEDLESKNEDYRIGPNDVLQVAVADLLAPGTSVPESPRVTASGNISLPLLERPVSVEGLTEAQAVQAIRDAYEDEQLLNNAQVSLLVLEARNRTFQIYGAVPQVGEYQILRSNYKMFDALTQAGGVSAAGGVEYAYVVRRLDNDNDAVGGDENNPVQPNEGGFEDLNPGADQGADKGADQGGADTGHRSDTFVVAQDGQMDAPADSQSDDADVNFVPPTDADGASDGASDGDSDMGSTEGRMLEIDGQQVELDRQMQADEGESMVEPGQIQDQTEPPMAMEPMDELPATQPGFEFETPNEPDDVEVIKVPVNLLLRGQLKYNVAIQPGDFVYVAPPKSLGYYYMGGHFSRVGVYQFNGQKVTITQATIAAGMLDPVAIPQRTMLVRYVSTPTGDYKVHARIDLSKIFAGTEPDLYLQPNDEIRVGTNALAPFIAAARNAFRITYGFGFLYDRNYARDDRNQ